MINRISLYFSTVRHMKPKQVISMLARPYLVKRAYKRKPAPLGFRNDTSIFIPEIDACESYLSRFNYDELKRDTFIFLHESHKINLSTWQVEASPLWIYNLHYFEYGVYLGCLWNKTKQPEYYLKFKELYQRWKNVNTYNSVAWDPYPTSLRLINLYITINLIEEKLKDDSSFYNELVESIYQQYRTLLLRQETWLLGNHYFENLFTIVVSSFLFEEEKVFKKYLKKLYKETKNQILKDGMHYELSPMYHKIILVDLLRLKQLSFHATFPQIDWLDTLISKMNSAMKMMENGFERTTLFNDSGDNVARSFESIEKACERMKVTGEEARSLDSAGYYKMSDDNAVILIDGGIIGPSFMPGHGHCDCLSFEMAINGKTVFVNSGTCLYQGDKRAYFRSTKAHNTVTIDGKEQSQCWGEHRVGKRIRRVKSTLRGHVFSGEYCNCRGKQHKRIINMEDVSVSVLDSTEGASTVKSYLHIAPGYKVTENLSIYDDDKVISSVIPKNSNYEICREGEVTYYASEFGKLKKGTCIVFTWENDRRKDYGYTIKY